MKIRTKLMIPICTVLLKLPFIISCTTDTALDHLNQGDIYIKQGQLDKAIREYGKAIERQTNMAEAYHKRGIAYRSKGQYELALADLSKVIELAPALAKAFYDRAMTYALTLQIPKELHS